MAGTIRNREEARAWQAAHEPSAPNVGELAPDFVLSDASGDNHVRLSHFRGERPVALAFGSFT